MLPRASTKTTPTFVNIVSRREPPRLVTKDATMTESILQ